MTAVQEQKQFNDYANFVVSTTSEESLRTEVMIDRLYGLSHTHKDTEFSQLLTAAIGMQAESGEFSEVIKKIDIDADDFDWHDDFEVDGETIYPAEVMDELADEFWEST